jgi:hypothetical protein
LKTNIVINTGENMVNISFYSSKKLKSKKLKQEIDRMRDSVIQIERERNELLPLQHDCRKLLEKNKIY